MQIILPSFRCTSKISKECLTKEKVPILEGFTSPNIYIIFVMLSVGVSL